MNDAFVGGVLFVQDPSVFRLFIYERAMSMKKAFTLIELLAGFSHEVCQRHAGIHRRLVGGCLAP